MKECGAYKAGGAALAETEEALSDGRLDDGEKEMFKGI